MTKFGLILRGAGIAALIACTATPAMAQSREDRARVAIGEARAKIDAAVKTGATGEVPTLVAQAQAALRSAEEQFQRDHNAQSIDEAHRASLLADQALGLAEKRKNEAALAERDQRVSAEAAASTAQANAETERMQRENAEAAAQSAQVSAADASARAAAAEQKATIASTDAAAARAALAAQPTATVTEVTTSTQPARSYSVKKATTVRRAAPKKKKAARTTTTVTTPATTTTTTIKTTEQHP